MYSTRVAYLFWAASFVGASGLHRLYMGKIGTGILFLVTGGLFGIGTIYDAITMPSQIREARLRAKMRNAIGDDMDDDGDDFTFGRRAALPSAAPPSESSEHIILRVAKANHGLVSPAQVALEGRISTDEAKTRLDELVDKGICEIQVRRSGTVAYVVPDFLDETGSGELEQF